jgi:hypothetical protein
MYVSILVSRCDIDHFLYGPISIEMLINSSLSISVPCRQELSKFREEIADFAGTLVSAEGNDNRPMQPLNGRQPQYCSL